MKLVEIFAAELHKWPEGALNLTQSMVDTEVYNELEPARLRPSLSVSERHDEGECYPIVTESQWQAERDKQKGGEWKRHRGGRKQPIEDGVKIEVKCRDGLVDTVISDNVDWVHYGHGADIMQYRIISQPQAEEIALVDKISTYKAFEPTGQWHQIDGPLAWRDTILHCQAIIEDCEREIQRNVDLLDAEGLMMQKDSKKAMQHYSYGALPFAAWQEGDILTSKVDYNKQFTKGKKYQVTNTYVSLGDDRVSVLMDDKGEANGWSAKHFEFHSRP